MRQAGVAKVNVRVDDSGKQMETVSAHGLIDPHARRRIDSQNRAVFNQDIRAGEATRQNTGGTGDESSHERAFVEEFGV